MFSVVYGPKRSRCRNCGEMLEGQIKGKGTKKYCSSTCKKEYVLKKRLANEACA